MKKRKWNKLRRRAKDRKKRKRVTMMGKFIRQKLTFLTRLKKIRPMIESHQAMVKVLN